MTTIVWHKSSSGTVTFLADRMVRSGDYIYYTDKVTKFNDILLSGAGSADTLQTYFHWIKNGCRPIDYPEVTEESNTTAMRVDSNGLLTTFWGPGNFVGIPTIPDNNIYVEGAGAAMVFGAILAGKSPIEAMLLVQSNAIYTGGGVQGYRKIPGYDWEEIKYLPVERRYAQT